MAGLNFNDVHSRLNETQVRDVVAPSSTTEIRGRYSNRSEAKRPSFNRRRAARYGWSAVFGWRHANRHQEFDADLESRFQARSAGG